MRSGSPLEEVPGVDALHLPREFGKTPGNGPVENTLESLSYAVIVMPQIGLEIKGECRNKAGGERLKEARCQVCIGDAAVQHHQREGTANHEPPAPVHPVQAGDHRGKDVCPRRAFSTRGLLQPDRWQPRGRYPMAIPCPINVFTGFVDRVRCPA